MLLPQLVNPGENQEILSISSLSQRTMGCQISFDMKLLRFSEGDDPWHFITLVKLWFNQWRVALALQEESHVELVAAIVWLEAPVPVVYHPQAVQMRT
jgi:hypothetical protein